MSLAIRNPNEEVWPLGSRSAKLQDNIKGSATNLFRPLKPWPAQRSRQNRRSRALNDDPYLIRRSRLTLRFQRSQQTDDGLLPASAQRSQRTADGSLPTSCSPSKQIARVSPPVRRRPAASRPSAEQSFGLQPSQLRLQAVNVSATPSAEIVAALAQRSLKVVTSLKPSSSAREAVAKPKRA